MFVQRTYSTPLRRITMSSQESRRIVEEARKRGQARMQAREKVAEFTAKTEAHYHQIKNEYSTKMDAIFEQYWQGAINLCELNMRISEMQLLCNTLAFELEQLSGWQDEVMRNR
jgi:hypothetical protein